MIYNTVRERASAIVHRLTGYDDPHYVDIVEAHLEEVKEEGMEEYADIWYNPV